MNLEFNYFFKFLALLILSLFSFFFLIENK